MTTPRWKKRNLERAKRAEAALLEYARVHSDDMDEPNDGGVNQDRLADFLTDLKHLADRKRLGLDIEDARRRAAIHYHAEAVLHEL
jgi:hypothetical protein